MSKARGGRYPQHLQWMLRRRLERREAVLNTLVTSSFPR